MKRKDSYSVPGFLASAISCGLGKEGELDLSLIVSQKRAVAAGVLNTLLNSALSKSVYPEEVGGTLGISASLESLTRVLSPSAGGYLLGSLGTWAPGLVIGLIMLWTVRYTWRRLIARPDPPLPGRLSETEVEV